VGLKNPWFVPINAILFYDFCLETVFCILTHYFRVPEFLVDVGSEYHPSTECHVTPTPTYRKSLQIRIILSKASTSN